MRVLCSAASALVAIALVFGVATAAQADRRVALVIGNSKYQAVSELANPRNDANAVATTLLAICFGDVRMMEDLDQCGLLRLSFRCQRIERFHTSF